MKNKRGQGMSIQTIILLILGLIILAVLILGFTIGWNQLTPWLSSNNVDSISTACSLACSNGFEYNFCLEPRNFKSADLKLKDVTCYELAENYTKYGINKCPEISCIAE